MNFNSRKYQNGKFSFYTEIEINQKGKFNCWMNERKCNLRKCFYLNPHREKFAWIGIKKKIFFCLYDKIYEIVGYAWQNYRQTNMNWIFHILNRGCWSFSTKNSLLKCIWFEFQKELTEKCENFHKIRFGRISSWLRCENFIERDS